MVCINKDLLVSDYEIKEIVTLVHQAGEIALKYFKKVPFQYKSDRSFLTQADLEIEYFLSEQIQATYPNHHFIGEEGTRNNEGAAGANVWTIDPIDGTTAFLQGLPGWGISIGLLQYGQPVFGLFYMPLLDDLTYTSSRTQLYCNGHHLEQSIRREWSHKGFLAVTASAHTQYRFNVKHTRALGSISANLVYTARGTAVCAFISRAYLWDLVAGAAILRRVGGDLRYLSGRPVDFLELLDGRLTPEPIVAGHPAALATLEYSPLKSNEQ